jgi:hypothetical protein
VCAPSPSLFETYRSCCCPVRVRCFIVTCRQLPSHGVKNYVHNFHLRAIVESLIIVYHYYHCKKSMTSGHLYYKYLLIYYYSGAPHKSNICTLLLLLLYLLSATRIHCMPCCFFNHQRRIIRSVFNIPIPQSNASLGG